MKGRELKEKNEGKISFRNNEQCGEKSQYLHSEEKWGEMKRKEK